MTPGKRLGAEFHEVGVVGGFEGEVWFFVGEGVLAQGFGFPAFPACAIRTMSARTEIWGLRGCLRLLHCRESQGGEIRFGGAFREKEHFFAGVRDVILCQSKITSDAVQPFPRVVGRKTLSWFHTRPFVPGRQA